MPIWGPTSTADDAIFKKSIQGEGNADVGEFLHSTTASHSSLDSQTTMYAWYRLKCPVGYSSAGAPRCWEITTHGCGRHAANSVMKKFYIVEANRNHSSSSGLQGTVAEMVYNGTSTAINTYGGSLGVYFYYKDNCSAWNTGEIYMRLDYAFREPTITAHFKTLMCAAQSVSYGAGAMTDVEFIGSGEADTTHDPSNRTSITITDKT